jgi:dihydrofolate reductase
MIRFIAAIDSKRGIADEHGIPWQGRIPTDVKYYHEQLKTADILMGTGVYRELSRTYPGVINYVATTNPNPQLRQGFMPVPDAHKFLEQVTGDIWNIGGAILFSSTIDLADELYLTRIDQDFNCTKFFPAFEDDFELTSSTSPQSENGITFHFEVWKRLQKQG